MEFLCGDKNSSPIADGLSLATKGKGQKQRNHFAGRQVQPYCPAASKRTAYNVKIILFIDMHFPSQIQLSFILTFIFTLNYTMELHENGTK